jgi:hypothetical protein
MAGLTAALAWPDLNISDYGEKVIVNMTKDEVKAKPEYKYSKAEWRDHVFSDKGPWSAGDPNRAARRRSSWSTATTALTCPTTLAGF